MKGEKLVFLVRFSLLQSWLRILLKKLEESLGIHSEPEFPSLEEFFNGIWGLLNSVMLVLLSSWLQVVRVSEKQLEAVVRK